MDEVREGMLEIRGYRRWARIYAICVFAAAGAFFLWLMWKNPSSKNSWFGVIMAVLCFWLSAYWLFLPKVLAVLTSEGMDYISEDLGLLFYYPRRRIEWSRVRGIRTFEQSGRGGPELVTILHAEDAQNPGKTRSFRITSGNRDYYRFVGFLKSVMDLAAWEKGGLPRDPTLFRRKLRRDQGRKLAMLLIWILVLVLVAYLLRR